MIATETIHTDAAEACERTARAFAVTSSLTPTDRARALQTLAAGLDARRDEIIRTAASETALTPDELAPEFARMTRTMELLGAALTAGTWHTPIIDTPPANPGDSIGPPHDLRRTLLPLGAIAVFGASNFPLAYGVCGGDTASALAAGCGVIVKEHPAHPRTGRLIAAVARDALARGGFPADALGYLAHPDPADFRPATALIGNAVIAGVGFTGSVRGGLAVEKLARNRAVPIPAFCEMGSVNPVVVTAAALDRRAESIANALADSILARFGQQCTCPGMLVIPRAAAGTERFVSTLSSRIAAARGRDMLAPWIRDGYLARLDEACGVPGVTVLARGAPAPGARGAGAALLAADHAVIARNAALQEEIFGPAAIVAYSDDHDLARVPLARGNLTCSVFFEDEEIRDGSFAARFGPHAERLAALAGRVIFNGVPTGPRVCHAMVHGGPFPSTNRPDSTAVGPMAIARWRRPVCYQNCPAAVLPKDLAGATEQPPRRMVARVTKPRRPS